MSTFVFTAGERKSERNVKRKVPEPDFSTYKWAPRGAAGGFTYWMQNNKGVKTLLNSNNRLRYISHLEKTSNAYKAAKLRQQQARKPRGPRAPGNIQAPAKKPRTNAGLPLVNRYNATNSGYVPRANANYRNNPNANFNNAKNKFGNSGGNVNSNNTGSYGPGLRYKLEKDMKPNNRKALNNKTHPLAALGLQLNVNGVSPFVHLLGKAFKMLQASTAQSFIGSKLETVAFDLAGKAHGMHTVYFDDPWSGRNSEGLPTGLGSRIVNVVKMYQQFPAIIHRPTMILKSRFSFAKSIKTSGELSGPLGQSVWWPIIRAGSYNPFYTLGTNGRKKYTSTLPSPITNTGQLPVGYHYTPFTELRAPGRGLGGESLYKGYTAVEPDVIIYYPPEFQLPGHKVGPRGEFRICELKVGPGANHKGVPAESFQLIKAKRSVQMAFERGVSRGEVQATPDVTLCFIPWFYAKVHKGTVNFENMYNKGAYDKRKGHEATARIASILGQSWKVHVLDTEKKVTEFTGINAAVATIVLDAYRKKDLTEVRVLLQYVNNYGLTESGRNLNAIQKAHQASRIAHKTHEGWEMLSVN